MIMKKMESPTTGASPNSRGHVSIRPVETSTPNYALAMNINAEMAMANSLFANSHFGVDIY